MPRNFLFLQGPHGPFFAQLAKMLIRAGCEARKICFNAGDRFYWDQKISYDDYQGQFDDWRSFISEYLREHAVTDLVVYGDAKPLHRAAIEIAKEAGVMVHCFEEGYLRPNWVTYERGGSNGFSPLLDLSIEEIKAKRAKRSIDLQSAPSTWGALWAHKWKGFVYHAAMWLGMNKYPNYQTPRELGVLSELKLHFIRLLMMPYYVVKRDLKTRKFLRTGQSFYAAMLQLEHDFSFRTHSSFSSQKDFIGLTVEEFVKNAPSHSALVFKSHPLDDGRAPLKKWIIDAAKAHGVSDRVIVFYGGKLGNLLNRSKGVIAINSTSVQHALWRGIPVKLMGGSVFGKPEICSQQSLGDFLKAPNTVSKDDYLEYRTFLLETSQIGGGFYTQSGRAEVLRRVVDMMLASSHPYEE